MNTLVFVSGARRCALPLHDVVETMRPLALAPSPGAPPFVAGVAIIRGTPTPVVHLDLLLGVPPVEPTRFVLLRIGDRRVALAVQEVVGPRTIDPAALDRIPPLLQGSERHAVEALGRLDGGLLLLLDGVRVLPAEAPEAIARVVRT